MQQSFLKVVKIKSKDLLQLKNDDLFCNGASPALVIGFVSPDLSLQEVSTSLKRILGSARLVLSSTAGELCSNETTNSGELYIPATEKRSQIILQIYSTAMIEESHIYTFDLYDLNLNNTEKILRIEKELNRIQVPFTVDYKHCVAYTLIDGLSNSENFYMEAMYNSGKFPCLSIGGSAGGHLDFKNTYIYNNEKVVQNKAVVTLIRFKETIGLGAFKTQNFALTNTSFTIGQSNENERYITSILDKETGQLVDFIGALCKHFNCREENLEKELANYNFAVIINGEIFIRSLASFNFEERKANFYCDICFGDELYLVKYTDFYTTTKNDFDNFMSEKKVPLIGALFNDCLQRRQVNEKVLKNITFFDEYQVAGFTTFGELLGVNINQTLTALFFFELGEGTFKDDFIDNFIQRYSGFKEYFLKRKLKQKQTILEMQNQILKKNRSGVVTLSNFIDDLMIFLEENEKSFENLNNMIQQLLDSVNISENNGLQISKGLVELGENANSVEQILNNILEIASQINLLGFNASIEAARAGKAGAGFAVVANEVKKLSSVTDEYAKNSNKSILDVISDMESLKKLNTSINTQLEKSKNSTGDLDSTIQDLVSRSKDSHAKIADYHKAQEQLINEIKEMDKTIEMLN